MEAEPGADGWVCRFVGDALHSPRPTTSTRKRQGGRRKHNGQLAKLGQRP